jgi:DNA repair photolyase
LLREELPRKRKKPTRVYFSPSSDAFQFIPDVQQVTYDTMSVLLEAMIEVSFLTKGFVSDRFLEMFRRYPNRVYAQFGITSLSRNLWHSFEPRTSSPEQRIRMIKSLVEMGVDVTVRLDPLIPDVTDTEANLHPLLEQLHAAGITFAAASYLFLRPAWAGKIARQIDELGADTLRPDEWNMQAFADGCGGGRTISEEQRRERFKELAEVGRHHGIVIAPCRCKNPTLTDGNCHIAGPPAEASQSAPKESLFPS